MNARLATLAAVLLVTSATASRAESEGHGDPFRHQAGHQVATGHSFTSDTAQTVYPLATGNRVQASSLSALEPAFGAEAVLHTANSLPAGANRGTVAFEQARAMDGRWAPARVLEAGVPSRRG